MENQKPIYKERAGSISIAVFENEGKTKEGQKYVFKTVNLQKSYKDKKGEWQNLSLSLRSDDIPKAVLLLSKSYGQCVMKEKAEEQD